MRRESSESIREPKGILKVSSKYTKPHSAMALNSSNSVYESVLKDHGRSVMKKERQNQKTTQSLLLDKSQQNQNSFFMHDRSITSLRNQPRADSSTALKREQLDLSTESKQFLLQIQPEKPPVSPAVAAAAAATAAATQLSLHQQSQQQQQQQQLPSALNSKRISAELSAKNIRSTPYNMNNQFSSQSATTTPIPNRFFSGASPGFSPQPQSFAQLKDLCPEDKRKIGQLMQRLSEEKQEKEKLREKLQQNEQLFNERIEEVHRDKETMFQATQNLQDRLQQSTKLLQRSTTANYINGREKSVSNILIPTPTSQNNFVPINRTLSNNNNNAIPNPFFPSTEDEIKQSQTPKNQTQQQQQLLLTGGATNTANDFLKSHAHQDSLDEEVHDFLQQSIQNQQPNQLHSLHIHPSKNAFSAAITTPIERVRSPNNFPSNFTNANTLNNNAATITQNPFTKIVTKSLALNTSPPEFKSNADLLRTSPQFQPQLISRTNPNTQIPVSSQLSRVTSTDALKPNQQPPSRVTLQKSEGQSEKLFNAWKNKIAAQTPDAEILANPYKSEAFLTRAEDIQKDDQTAVAEIASLKAAMQSIVGSLQQIGSPDYFSTAANTLSSPTATIQSPHRATLTNKTLGSPSRQFNSTYSDDDNEDEFDPSQNDKLQKFLEQKRQKLSSAMQDIRKDDMLDITSNSTIAQKQSALAAKRTQQQQLQQKQQQYEKSTKQNNIQQQKKSNKKSIDIDISSEDFNNLNNGSNLQRLQAKLSKSGLTTKSIESMSRQELKQLKTQLERKQNDFSESVSYDLSSQNLESNSARVGTTKSRESLTFLQNQLGNQHYHQPAATAQTVANTNHNNNTVRVSNIVQTPLRNSMQTNTFDVSYSTQLQQSLKDSDNNNLLRFSNQTVATTSNPRSKAASTTHNRHNQQNHQQQQQQPHQQNQQENEDIFSARQQQNNNTDSNNEVSEDDYILVEENSSIKKQILAKIEQLTEEDMTSVLQAIKQKKTKGSAKPTDESLDPFHYDQSSSHLQTQSSQFSMRQNAGGQAGVTGSMSNSSNLGGFGGSGVLGGVSSSNSRGLTKQDLISKPKNQNQNQNSQNQRQQYYETDHDNDNESYVSAKQKQNSQQQLKNVKSQRNRGAQPVVEYEDMLFEVVQQIEETSNPSSCKRNSQQQRQLQEGQYQQQKSQNSLSQEFTQNESRNNQQENNHRKQQKSNVGNNNSSSASFIDLQKMEEFLHMDSSFTETDQSIQEIKQRISLQS